jgi:hypothetical protein
MVVSWKKLAAANGQTEATKKADQGQCCTRNPGRMNFQEETLGETGKHQWNKGLRLKESTTSEKGGDIRQDLRENHWAGDREANSQAFCQDLKNE